MDLYHLLQALTVLVLWNNKIGDAGAQYLAKALQHNSVRLGLFSQLSHESLIIRNRYSPSLMFDTTKLAVKEHGI
jgi:hypothetical protein